RAVWVFGIRSFVERSRHPSFLSSFAAWNGRFRRGDFRTPASVHHSSYRNLQPVGNRPPTQAFVTQPYRLIAAEHPAWTAKGFAVRSCGSYSRHGPLPNHLLFKFGKCAHDGQHESGHRAAFLRANVLG